MLVKGNLVTGTELTARHLINKVLVTRFFLVAAVGAAATAGPQDGTRAGRDGGRSPTGPP